MVLGTVRSSWIVLHDPRVLLTDPGSRSSARVSLLLLQDGVAGAPVRRRGWMVYLFHFQMTAIRCMQIPGSRRVPQGTGRNRGRLAPVGMRGSSQREGGTMKHRWNASGPLLSEEEFASWEVLRQTAEKVNFVWLLAELHGRPEARRFLDLLVRGLASRVRQPQGGHRAKLE